MLMEQHHNSDWCEKTTWLRCCDILSALPLTPYAGPAHQHACTNASRQWEAHTYAFAGFNKHCMAEWTKTHGSSLITSWLYTSEAGMLLWTWQPCPQSMKIRPLALTILRLPYIFITTWPISTSSMSQCAEGNIAGVWSHAGVQDQGMQCIHQCTNLLACWLYPSHYVCIQVLAANVILCDQ